MHVGGFDSLSCCRRCLGCAVETRSFVRLLISSCLTLQPSLSLSLPPTPCSTARCCTAGACLRGRPSLATLLSSSTPEKLCRMLWQASHLGDSWEGTCLLRTATCTVCAFIIEYTGEVAPHSVAGEHWQHMAWTIALHAPPRRPWIAQLQSGQWRESPSLLQTLSDAALHSPPRRTASRPRSPTAWSRLFLCLQTSGRSGTRRRVPGNARHAFVHCFESLFVFLQTSGRSGTRRRVPAPCTCSASTRAPSSTQPSRQGIRTGILQFVALHQQ